MGIGANLVNRVWQLFVDETSRWRDSGRELDFWWRDDDAAIPATALSRLIDLARNVEVPLALAVVPHQLDPAMWEPDCTVLRLLQHGVDHRNRARPGEKKTEFADEEPIGLTEDDTGGRSQWPW